MKKIGFAIGLLLVLGVAVWMLQGKPAPLIMGTHAHFPPFEMVQSVDDGEEIVGFDVELAQAIAAKTGRPLTIIDMPFDNLIPALDAGTIDMALVAMSMTDERAQRVDFSEPYYTATQVVLIREGDAPPTTREELATWPIAAQTGTTSAALALDIAGADNVRQTTSAKAAIVDLLNSQVNAVLIDEQPAATFRKIFPEAHIIPLPFPEEYYAVAVRKDNKPLLKLINATLRDIKADGRYDWFIDRWLVQAN